MVKQLMISPDDVRRKETIALGIIPVNAYAKTLSDELVAGALTKADAVRIYRDMVLIREFETMLDEIKGWASTVTSRTSTRAPPTSPLARRPPPWARRFS